MKAIAPKPKKRVQAAYDFDAEGPGELSSNYIILTKLNDFSS